MSILSDFNKLHITTKSAILSVAVIMPFWFISIYLFNKPLYNKQDFYILVSFCFCFSLTWYAMNIILTLIIPSAVGDKEGSNDFESIFIIGGLISVFYLSGVIIVTYYYGWSFQTFLIVAYSYILFRILGMCVIWATGGLTDDEKKTPEEKEPAPKEK